MLVQNSFWRRKAHTLLYRGLSQIHDITGRLMNQGVIIYLLGKWAFL